MLLSNKKWDPKGLHCYVTGGSQGLGLETAKILVQRGAHVTIVARGVEKLKEATAELEKLRRDPNQKIHYLSHSLTSAQESAQALDEAAALHGGRCPDALFLCAGASTPRFFVDDTEETLRKCMDDSYWVQAWSAHAGVKRMVQDDVKGKIVLVSSILGYFGMIGYANYSPGKHALRGLAESLRSELILYDISIHCFFPATILSPGYERENITKPAITKKLEETDDGVAPDVYARGLIQGIEAGHFHITSDLLANIFRASTRGNTPQNNPILDRIYGFFGFVGLPIWRWTVDHAVRGHREEHAQYVAQKFGSGSSEISK
ncbi:oxidoreductase [Schizophyllum amplum]|uniref:3-dehydrosphinganine reductase n=1 Tax=Schizophyllum amplum TaxID=97359 RepID=A0A550CSI2_9AGAR|nr:oxidoreductase [Auriculariopsis ampla]